MICSIGSGAAIRGGGCCQRSVSGLVLRQPGLWIDRPSCCETRSNMIAPCWLELRACITTCPYLSPLSQACPVPYFNPAGSSPRRSALGGARNSHQI